MAARKRAKINIPMAAACVLLCLTLFSIHFTGDIYAKYTAKGSGMDSSRAAKFEITEEVTRGEEFLAAELVLDFVPGTTNVEVSVENKSEVAVDYTITIEN
ncbi:MAG: hypothetical protein IKJ57_04190, partial [Oscillospiraceae bacterium]|nr:hypothetical protein [Oscillospiraceae bacterium]